MGDQRKSAFPLAYHKFNFGTFIIVPVQPEKWEHKF